MSYNKIKKIDQDVFNGLESLETIHLSNNQIYSIEKETFRGLIKLENIKLDRNPLWESNSKTLPVSLLFEPSVSFISIKDDLSNNIDLFRQENQSVKRVNVHLFKLSNYYSF